MTPNYNDGKWHAWNGGQCPVHPKSVVECRLRSKYDEHGDMAEYAECWQWEHLGKGDIIAFRVVTPYAEPAPDVAFGWGNKEEVAKITKAAKGALKDMQKPAKRDLRTIDEPFGELDERTQNRLRKAKARGWPVQYRCSGGGWVKPEARRFLAEGYYRLDPTFTPPPNRAVFWLTNSRVFQSAREAKTAYPGSDPVKVKVKEPTL